MTRASARATPVPVSSTARSAIGALLLVAATGFMVGAYFVLRYAGLWSEQDTAVFRGVVGGMVEAGRLDYPGAYAHGYAYSVWAATLSMVTGIGISDLTQLYLPLLGNTLLGVFGFALFRYLLASDRLGAIAATILFLVPELVFTVSRGNHEKMTVTLTLLAILALANGFHVMRVGGRMSVFVGWVAVFYATGFTLITLNVLFGSGFVFASSIALAFFYVGMTTNPRSRPALQPVAIRLLLVSTAAWLMLALVLLYVYPQARANLGLVAMTVERLTLLVGVVPWITTEQTALPFSVSDPYTVGGTDWADRTVFRIVSSFRWVLFASSFTVWVVLLFTLRRAVEPPRLHVALLVALYGAYGVMLALTIPVDFLGLAAGSNLQVRFYVYFTLFAAPMLVYGIDRLLTSVRSPRMRNVSIGVLVSIGAGFFVISLLKATLDPSVSNRWLFYQPEEVQAIHAWASRHSGDNLWIGGEPRLAFALALEHAGETYERSRGSLQTGDGPTGAATHALRSDPIEADAVAWGVRPPGHWLEQRVYDNGTVQIFHRAPRTPFQR